MFSVDVLEFVPVEKTSSRTVEIFELLDIYLDIIIDPAFSIHIDEFMSQFAKHYSIFELVG